MQPSTLSAAIALFTALLACPSRAAAPPEVRAAAEQLYQDAYDLIRAGRYAEACPMLEESDRLDPANGTKLELAQCYERTRRPASAWVLYVTVADADHQSGKNPEREALASNGARALEPDLPMLTIVVPGAMANLPGLEVKRDDVVLKTPAWGTAVPVDLGEHRIVASAPGKLPWEGRYWATKLRDRGEIVIPTLEDAPRVAPPRSTREVVREGGSNRRTLMFLTGGAAVTGIAVGSTFGVAAIVRWSDVKAAARTECMDPIHFKGCSTAIAGKQSDASLFATVSTIGFIAGGASVIGMAALWLSEPPRAPQAARIQFTPSFGPGGAGGLLRGTF